VGIGFGTDLRTVGTMKRHRVSSGNSTVVTKKSKQSGCFVQTIFELRVIHWDDLDNIFDEIEDNSSLNVILSDSKDQLDLEIGRWKCDTITELNGCSEWEWDEKRTLVDAELRAVPFKSGKTKHCFQVSSPFFET
jgi:hypothetical protein